MSLVAQAVVAVPTKKSRSNIRQTNRDLGIHGSSVVPWSLYCNQENLYQLEIRYVHFIAIEDAHRLVAWGVYDKDNMEASLAHTCLAENRETLRNIVKLWNYTFIGTFVRDQITRLIGVPIYQSYQEYVWNKQAYQYLAAFPDNKKRISKIEAAYEPEFLTTVVPKTLLKSNNPHVYGAGIAIRKEIEAVMVQRNDKIVEPDWENLYLDEYIEAKEAIDEATAFYVPTSQLPKVLANMKEKIVTLLTNYPEDWQEFLTHWNALITKHEEKLTLHQGGAVPETPEVESFRMAIEKELTLGDFYNLSQDDFDCDNEFFEEKCEKRRQYRKERLDWLQEKINSIKLEFSELWNEHLIPNTKEEKSHWQAYLAHYLDLKHNRSVDYGIQRCSTYEDCVASFTDLCTLYPEYYTDPNSESDFDLTSLG